MYIYYGMISDISNGVIYVAFVILILFIFPNEAYNDLALQRVRNHR